MPDFTQTDRDMLIKHDVKLTRVCEDIHGIDDKMEKGFEKLEDLIVGQQETCMAHREKIAASYISKRMFQWIAGFIITGLVGMGIYSGGMSTQIDLNTHKIEILEKK